MEQLLGCEDEDDFKNLTFEEEKLPTAVVWMQP